MKKIIVFYHADCSDGFGAAWAARKKLGAKAEYIAIKAAQGPRQLRGVSPKGKEVYFLDSCADAATIRKLKKENKSVAVIDHHATNAEAAREASVCVFDLAHSGAVLSWKYFHPKKKVPWLLRYLEDNDLWKFKLPRSKEISAWLMSAPFDFVKWDRLAPSFEKAGFRKRHADIGKIYLDFEDSMIDGIVSTAYEVAFEGYKAMVANTSVSHSQVGHRLLDKSHPVSITWFDSGDVRKYSLRSVGALDVSRLARRFPGGGGHKHAAGFSLSVDKPFPWNPVHEHVARGAVIHRKKKKLSKIR